MIITKRDKGTEMNYTYDDNLYSDFHFDAYGFRPEKNDDYYTSTPERKQRLWNLVAEQLEWKLSEDYSDYRGGALS